MWPSMAAVTVTALAISGDFCSCSAETAGGTSVDALRSEVAAAPQARPAVRRVSWCPPGQVKPTADLMSCHPTGSPTKPPRDNGTS